MAITDQQLDDPTKGINLDDLIYQARKARGVYKTPADEIAAQGEAQGLDVTSKNTGRHAPNSQHYHDNAVDFRTKNQSPETINNYINTMISQGRRVLDERSKRSTMWSGPHIHVEGGGGNQVNQAQPQVSQVSQEPQDPLDQIIAQSRADRARARGFNNFMGSAGMPQMTPGSLMKPGPAPIPESRINTNIQAPGNIKKPARPKLAQPQAPQSLNQFLSQGGIETSPIPKDLTTAMSPGYTSPSAPKVPAAPSPEYNDLTNQDFQTGATKQALNALIPGMGFVSQVFPEATDNVARRLTSFRNRGIRGVGNTLLAVPEALPVMQEAMIDASNNRILPPGSWNDVKNAKPDNTRQDAWGVRGVTDQVRNLIKAQFPVEDLARAGRVEKFIMETLPEAAGSQAAFAAMSILTGGGAKAAALMGLLVNGSQSYDDALQKGATKAQALQVAQINGLAGLTEGLGFGGGVSHVAGRQGLLRRGLGLVEEPLQEGFQQFTQNASEKYTGAVPNQSLTEGVGESMLAAGLLSGGAHVGGMIGNKMLENATPLTPEQQAIRDKIAQGHVFQFGTGGADSFGTAPQGLGPVSPQGPTPSGPGPGLKPLPPQLIRPKGKTGPDTVNQLPFNPLVLPDQQNLDLQAPPQAPPPGGDIGLSPDTGVPVTPPPPVPGTSPGAAGIGLPGRRGKRVEFTDENKNQAAENLVNNLTNRLAQQGLVPSASPEAIAPESAGSINQPGITPQAPPQETAAGAPPGKVVTYDGETHVITDPEKIKRWEQEVETPRRNAKKSGDKGRIQAVGHRTAAVARDILNKPTAKEAAARARREAGNYQGKPVSVDIAGRKYNGTVVHSTFSRVKIRLADGQEVNVKPELIGSPLPESSAPAPPVEVNTTFESKGQNKTPVVQDLLGFVRQNGGIKETDYNLGDMAGLTNKESGTSGIIKKTGITADEMRAMAVSEGLSTAETVSDFVEELKGHLRDRQKGIGPKTEADIDNEFKDFFDQQIAEDERIDWDNLQEGIANDEAFKNLVDRVSHETEDPTSADLRDFRQLAHEHGVSSMGAEQFIQEWADNREENRGNGQGGQTGQQDAGATTTPEAPQAPSAPPETSPAGKTSKELTPNQRKLHDAARTGYPKAIASALGTIGKRQMDDGSINPDLVQALEGTDVEARLVESQGSDNKPIETKVQLVHKTTGEVLGGVSQESVDRAARTKAERAKREAKRSKKSGQSKQAAPATQTGIERPPTAPDVTPEAQAPASNYPAIEDRKVSGSEVYGNEITQAQARAIDRRINERLGTEKGPTTKFTEMAFRKHELLGEDENATPPPFAAVDSVREGLDLPVISKDDPNYSNKIHHTLDALAEKFNVKRLSQLNEEEYNKVADWVAGLDDDVAIEAFSRSYAAMVVAHEGAQEFFANSDVQAFMKTVQDYLDSHNGELPGKKVLQAAGINANIQDHLKTLAQGLNIPIAKEAFKNFYEDWKLTGGRFDYGGQRWLAYQYANRPDKGPGRGSGQQGNPPPGPGNKQAPVPGVLREPNGATSGQVDQGQRQGSKGTSGKATRSRRSAQPVQASEGSVINETNEATTSSGELNTPDGVQQRGPGSGSSRGAKSQRKLITARESLLPKVDLSVVNPEIAQNLASHQLEGAARAIASLEKTGGFLNADGTGAGKTRQLLAVAAHYAKKGKKVLLVAPNAVLGKPFEKKSKGQVTGSYANDAKALGIDFTLNKGDQGLESGKIHVTTYTTSGFDDLADQVDKDTVLILDESHEFKNTVKGTARAITGLKMIQDAGKVLYASATPADKPHHLEYLGAMGALEGKRAAQQFMDLGLLWRDHPHHKGVIQWYVDPRVGAAEVNRRVEALFGRMVEQGQMIKREISLEGMKVNFSVIPASVELNDVLARIAGLYDGSPKMRGVMLQHQRRQQETFKVQAAVEKTKQALANGEQVVLFASRVNESEVAPTYRDLAGNKVKGPAVVSSEGTVKLLREALAKEGITDVSEIHGGSTTSAAQGMADFQSGKNRVVIATVESGGTGINLDDTVGDRPRAMIIMTAPFDAVSAIQALGRIWRLTTKSNARAEYIFADTEVDNWNRAVIARKMQMMHAVVAGDVGSLDVSNMDNAELEAQYDAVLEGRRANQPKPVKNIFPEVTLSPDGSQVSLSFPHKPNPAVLSTIKAKGFKFNWDTSSWVAPNNGDNRAFAENIADFARKGQTGAAPIITDLVDLLTHPNPLPDAQMPTQQDIAGYVGELSDAIRAGIKSGKLKLDMNNPFQMEPVTQARFDLALNNLINAWQIQDHASFIQARMDLANILNSPKHKLIGDALRPLMLAVDGSFALMQGGWNLITHPTYWVRAGLTSFKIGTHNHLWDLVTGLHDPKTMWKFLNSRTTSGFNEFIAQIESHPHAAEWKTMGLTLDSRAELELRSAKQELTEGYTASFINKLPGFKQSEIAMKVMLDVLKIQAYEGMRNILVSKRNLDPVTQPAEFKKAARWALISSGRGDFGQTQAGMLAAKVTGGLGLAPRFVLSGFQQLFLPWKYLIKQGWSSARYQQFQWNSPIEKHIVADATKAYMVTASLMALATLGLGWEIPKDPDDPKFLMAKVPGSNLAFPVVPSNLQPPVKFLARLVKRVLQLETVNPVLPKSIAGHENLTGAMGRMWQDTVHFGRSKLGIIQGAVAERAIPYQRTRFSPPATGREDLSNSRPKNVWKSTIQAASNKFTPGAFEKADQAISKFGGYGSDYLGKPVNLLDSITARLAPIYANNILENLTNPQLTRKEAVGKSTWEFFGGRSVGLRSTYSDVSRISRSVRDEFQDKGIPFLGVRQEQGETDDQYTRRMTKAEDLYDQYGQKIINNSRYQGLSEEAKAKVMAAFKRRVGDFNEGQANKARPDYTKLELNNILDSMETGKRRQLNIDKRRRRENLSFRVE